MKPEIEISSEKVEERYTQDWPAYNQAQATEKVKFKDSDLLDVIQEKKGSSTGRNGMHQNKYSIKTQRLNRGENMHAAFIMMSTEKGKPFSVAEKVSEIDSVELAYPVTGPYDVIACLEAENDLEEKLKDTVEEIHSIDGVLSTLTSIAVH